MKTTMSSNTKKEFEQFLSGKHAIVPRPGSESVAAQEKTLRKLWQSTDLSADDFANEVAIHYQLRRLSLAQLLAASPLVGRFSSRFLREMTIFPYQVEEGEVRLAVGDPSDLACIRAAEIVLGGSV